jgi:hypothetical protein
MTPQIYEHAIGFASEHCYGRPLMAYVQDDTPWPTIFLRDREGWAQGRRLSTRWALIWNRRTYGDAIREMEDISATYHTTFTLVDWRERC